jgi:osmotically-inducible protein OsmY
MKDAVQKFILAAAAGVALAALAGCQSQHPDAKAAVYQALSQHDLASVEVFQDRSRGVITLRGIVGGSDSRSRAEQVAEQAAPGYTVKNQLTVNNIGITATATPSSGPTPSAPATPAAQPTP